MSGTSGVVLRCPSCGTTQADAGECEACHEADVRFFCVNHTPGRWLDGPVCAECAARPAHAPTPPPPRRTRPAVTPPADRAPGRRPRPRVESPWEPVAEPPRERSRERPRERTRERTRSRRVIVDGTPVAVGVPTADTRAVARAAGSAARSAIGCVARLVILAIVIVGLLAALFFGGSLRDWTVDLGRQVGLAEGTPEQTRRGIEAFRAGDRAAAERELREAARLYPRSALALLYLARIASDEGDDARAIEHLEEALRREPSSAVANREMGALLLAQVIDEPSDVTARARGAELLPRARLYLIRALALTPADRRANELIACVFERQGDPEAALRVRERAGLGEGPVCPAPRRSTTVPTDDERAPGGRPDS